jgi:hypothetical protein
MILEMESLRKDHAQEALVWDQEKKALQQQLAQLQAQLENTQASLGWTEEQLQNHRASLDEVLNSMSWKITKPLRALKG